MDQIKPKLITVDDYLAQCPPQALTALNQLRQLIKDMAPEAAEVISYGILGYKLPSHGRAFVYTSGYAKHVSVYPIPHPIPDKLTKELEPYVAGKGTLRFDLNKPLPIDLVSRVVTELYNRDRALSAK